MPQTTAFFYYSREKCGLVAEYAATAEEKNAPGAEALGGKRIAGIARYVRNHSDDGAEVAFIVADKHQNRGLGTWLLERIIEIAKTEGIQSLQGAMLAENVNMQDLFVRAGFKFAPPQEGMVTATMELNPSSQHSAVSIQS